MVCALTVCRVNLELDRYLQKRFGRPAGVRAVQVFGQGIEHTFGDGDRFRLRLAGDDGVPPPIAPGMRQLEDLASEVTEYFMLAGPPEAVVVPGYDPRAHTIYDQQFVEQERELAWHLATMLRSKLPDIMYARALVGDVFPLLEPTLRHAGLPPSVLPLEATRPRRPCCRSCRHCGQPRSSSGCSTRIPHDRGSPGSW